VQALKVRHPTRVGSQRIPRHPSKVSRLYRHLEEFDAPLVDDRDVNPDENVR
jgi:hypothetical protein